MWCPVFTSSWSPVNNLPIGHQVQSKWSEAITEIPKISGEATSFVQICLSIYHGLPHTHKARKPNSACHDGFTQTCCSAEGKVKKSKSSANFQIVFDRCYIFLHMNVESIAFDGFGRCRHVSGQKVDQTWPPANWSWKRLQPSDNIIGLWPQLRQFAVSSWQGEKYLNLNLWAWIWSFVEWCSDR